MTRCQVSERARCALADGDGAVVYQADGRRHAERLGIRQIDLAARAIAQMHHAFPVGVGLGVQGEQRAQTTARARRLTTRRPPSPKAIRPKPWGLNFGTEASRSWAGRRRLACG